MYQEIMPGLVRLEIPLPGSPLRSVNAYLLKNSRPGGRHLLIDNGFNRPESLAAMLAGLEQARVRLEDLDFFVSHAHVDHFGLTGALRRNSQAPVFCSQADSEYINAVIRGCTPAELARRLDGFWGANCLPMLAHGFPRHELDGLLDAHPGPLFSPEHPLDFTPLADNARLEYGRWQLRVVAVPGHSPEMLTLYEENEKLYFSADHVLADITPNISFWRVMPDPLATYLDSLDKSAALNIRLSLPAHRRLIEDTAGRIRQIKEHHGERLAEVMAILAQGPFCAYQVAARLTWSVRARNWAEFPLGQKWFAVGEAYTHLRYLAGQGRVHEIEKDGLIEFSL